MTIISLPTANRQLLKFGITFKFHSFNEKFLGFRIRRRLRKLYPAHHWEIDFSEPHSLENVLKILRESFPKVSCKTLEQIPYHTFFICEKS